MSLTRLHFTFIAGWFTAVVLLVGIRLALLAPPSPTESVTWLLVLCVPPTILLSVFRGAPPQTVGEVLYDVEHPVISGRTAISKGSQTHVARD